MAKEAFFSFLLLDLDCLHCLLVYLSPLERIKYERVSNAWREEFFSIWRTQKVLVFLRRDAPYWPHKDLSFMFDGPDSAHCVRRNDLIPLSRGITSKNLVQIVAKCFNLRAFVWLAGEEVVLDALLASALNCHDLEHFELDAPYPEFTTAIQTKSVFRGARFREGATQLCFLDFMIRNTLPLSRLTFIHIDGGSQLASEKLIDCSQLRHLSIGAGFEETSNLPRFPHLCSLELAKTDFLASFLDYTSLTAISLTITDTYFDEALLVQLLCNNQQIACLRIKFFSYYKRIQDYLLIVANCAGNLKSFHLIYVGYNPFKRNDDIFLSNQDYAILSRLTKLRSFIIDQPDANALNLPGAFCLSHCLKLRSLIAISKCFQSSSDRRFEESLKAFRVMHPKRSINVQLFQTSISSSENATNNTNLALN